MRYVVAAAVLSITLAITSGCSESSRASSGHSSSDATATKVAFNPSAPAISFNVPGMTCSHCAKSVTEALGTVAGVTAVEATAETKTARVNIDQDKFNADAALAKLAESGYEDASLAEAAH